MSEIPFITSENFGTVYPQYAERVISQRTAEWGHRASGLLLRQETSWAEGAEEFADEHLGYDGQLFLAAHHSTFWDVLELPSLLEREPALQLMRGNIFIAAKRAMFKYRIGRKILNNLGVIPVFRQEKEEDLVHDGNRKTIKSTFIDTIVKLLDKGENGAGMPHGTYSKNPREIGKLKTGLFEAILQSVNCENIAILPIGIAYPNWQLRPKGGHIHIGEPIMQLERFSDHTALTEQVATNLQAAVDKAYGIN